MSVITQLAVGFLKDKTSAGASSRVLGVRPRTTMTSRRLSDGRCCAVAVDGDRSARRGSLSCESIALNESVSRLASSAVKFGFVCRNKIDVLPTRGRAHSSRASRRMAVFLLSHRRRRAGGGRRRRHRRRCRRRAWTPPRPGEPRASAYSLSCGFEDTRSPSRTPARLRRDRLSSSSSRAAASSDMARSV